jgi:hypothetical protein
MRSDSDGGLQMTRTRLVQQLEEYAADLEVDLEDWENKWAMACRILGIPEDSSGGRFRDAIRELKKGTNKTEDTVDD